MFAGLTNHSMRNAILFWLLFFFPCLAQTQTPHPWEAGGGIGIGAYQGDLQTTKTNFESLQINTAISAHLRRNLDNLFAVRLGLLYTQLSGNDHQFPTRAFSFTSPLIECSILGEVYPFGLYKTKKRDHKQLSNTRRRVTPFVALGVSAVYFNPKNDWNEANNYGGIALGRIQTDIDIAEAKNFAIALPMGAGIRLRVTNRFTLGLEGILRYAQNDYLDGVSIAGDPAKNDWFYTAQVAVSYSFGEPNKPNRSLRKSQRNAEDKTPSPDTDNDGVPDDKDDCPDIPGLQNLMGCPDADRDGIPDKKDLCPEEFGLPTLSGCPDRDEDGIADKDDNCPELKGVLAYRGCPAVDRDKDGVADAEDLCPDMNGQLRWKGCPDSDSDGIPDNKDACPGIAGSEHLRGCPDTDGDGIPDKDDECPTISGIASKKGCPEAMPSAPGVPYKAVYFNSTLDDWQVTSLITLDEIVTILNADPALFARIEGHTDNTGREPANDLLAEKRAKKCLDNLVSSGISVERLNYIGFGAQKPVVPNDTRERRQLNRRVEVHFYKK